MVSYIEQNSSLAAQNEDDTEASQTIPPTVSFIILITLKQTDKYKVKTQVAPIKTLIWHHYKSSSTLSFVQVPEKDKCLSKPFGLRLKK